MGLLPDGAKNTVRTNDAPVSGLRFADATHHVAFWTLMCATMLSNLGFGLVFVHQIAYLIGRGYDSVLAASVVALMGIVSIPGRVVFNLASAWRPPKGLLCLALTAQGSGVAILAMLPAASWLFVYVIVYGITFGAVGTLRAATISDYFGRRAYGSIASATALAGYCAGAVGIVAAGWLFDVLGSYQLVLWGSVALTSLAVVIVGATPPLTTRRSAAL